MTRKIAVLTVDNYEKEAPIRRAFQKVIRQQKCEWLDLAGINPDDPAQMRNRLKEAAKIFLVFDAGRGMSYAFSRTAQVLLNLYQSGGSKPILVIAGADDAEADLACARQSLEDVWSMHGSGLSEADTDFTTLYYSYRFDSFSFLADDFPAREAGQELLADLIDR